MKCRFPKMSQGYDDFKVHVIDSCVHFFPARRASSSACRAHIVRNNSNMDVTGWSKLELLASPILIFIDNNPPKYETGTGRLDVVQSLTLDTFIDTANAKTTNTVQFGTSHVEKTLAPTTLLTYTIPQQTLVPSQFPNLTSGATPSGSSDQLNLSKAQLVVGILTLVGVGKVCEVLGKKAWKTLGTHIA
jgi:hypothetical protein